MSVIAVCIPKQLTVYLLKTCGLLDAVDLASGRGLTVGECMSTYMFSKDRKLRIPQTQGRAAAMVDTRIAVNK